MRIGTLLSTLVVANILLVAGCGKINNWSTLKSASDPQSLDNYQVTNTFHDDGRPKLVFNPDWSNFDSSNLKGEELAKAYVASQSALYGATGSGSELTLVQTQESLLGTHYTFQQAAVEGVLILDGQLIVSVDNSGQRITMVYSSVTPTEAIPTPSSRQLITNEKAEAIAWSSLHVQSRLLDAPQVKSAYIKVDGRLVLAKLVFFQLENPFGAWETSIDAASGKILAQRDTSIYKKAPRTTDWKAIRSKVSRDRLAAYAEYYTRTNAQRMTLRLDADTTVDGSALVFDPDPLTWLNKLDLSDTSPASMFDPAYLLRTLPQITKTGTSYSLKGPWVQIIDFESPATAPSTTTDGKWTAKRGNNAFNDAMTYFHIDQNQRYLQSLGFTGTKAVQGVSIEADSDGVNGDDNSHYIPSSNRLAFGHGCVDDNEDADVILHEYGHALTHSIDPNWDGGDTGAMGEGFGDYWGASYGYSKPETKNVEPFHAFHFDGTASCWPGRRLDAFAARYDATTTYQAHTPIAGGFQSDELWGTPITQALWTLMSQGVAREEVDRIMIQSFFGLGSGVKMRDMANAIVNTARTMYPQGPHARVFIEKFSVHEILLMPHPKLVAAAPVLTNTGHNGAADPGEEIMLSVALGNTGDMAATKVAATLVTSDPNVTIVEGATTYPDMAIGAAGVVPAKAFTVKISDKFTCGASVPLTLKLSSAEVSSADVELKIQTGTSSGGISQSLNPELAIPDNVEAGLTSPLAITTPNVFVSKSFTVMMNVQHTYIGDLVLKLTSPNGTTVVLKNQGTGGSADNIVGDYPTSLVPVDSFDKLMGQPLTGTWKLMVADTASSDVGTLKSWGIKNEGPYQCE